MVGHDQEGESSTDYAGYQFKLSANIIANAGFVRQFAEGGAKLNSTHVSVFGGLTSAGLVIGGIVIPPINERFGRKIGIYAFLGALAIGSIIEAVSTVWWHWVIAKLFAGIGIGACQATLPVVGRAILPSSVKADDISLSMSTLPLLSEDR